LEYLRQKFVWIFRHCWHPGFCECGKRLPKLHQCGITIANDLGAETLQSVTDAFFEVIS
jgi:hypothetical protein